MSRLSTHPELFTKDSFNIGPSLYPILSDFCITPSALLVGMPFWCFSRISQYDENHVFCWWESLLRINYYIPLVRINYYILLWESLWRINYYIPLMRIPVENQLLHSSDENPCGESTITFLWWESLWRINYYILLWESLWRNNHYILLLGIPLENQQLHHYCILHARIPVEVRTWERGPEGDVG